MYCYLCKINIIIKQILENLNINLNRYVFKHFNNDILI